MLLPAALLPVVEVKVVVGITVILPLVLGLGVGKGSACVLCFAEARQSYRNDS